MSYAITNAAGDEVATCTPFMNILNVVPCRVTATWYQLFAAMAPFELVRASSHPAGSPSPALNPSAPADETENTYPEALAVDPRFMAITANEVGYAIVVGYIHVSRVKFLFVAAVCAPLKRSSTLGCMDR